MRLIFVILATCLFGQISKAQGVQLNYLGGDWNIPASWIQINTPTGQTPIQRVPTEVDDVIIGRNLFLPLGNSTLNVGSNLTSGYRCKSLHISHANVYFEGSNSDDGGSINVQTNTGGFVLIDSSSNIHSGRFSLNGGNPTMADFEIKNSVMGELQSHQDKCGVNIQANGVARFINSTVSGYSYACSNTGGSIYAANSTFNLNNFRIGDNGNGNLNNCIFQNNVYNVSMSFIIGKNVGLLSENLTINSYRTLNLCTSGKVLKANINVLNVGATVEFSQITPALPLPNIIDGNIEFYEADVTFRGDLSISGNFKHYSTPFIYSNFTSVLINNLPVFYYAGSPSYPFKLELFGSANTTFTWPVGFKVDTLIINKSNCAKVDFLNGLYVKGETRIQKGQFILNPLDTVPYHLICGGNLIISPGGGLFLRKNSDGTVANIAVNGNFIDSNLVVDSLCAGFSNPYGGNITLFRTSQNTGSPSLFMGSNSSLGNFNFTGVSGSTMNLISPLTVNNFTFTNPGKVLLGAHNLKIKSSIINYAADKYFATNGVGKLIIQNIGNTPVVFPVGPSTNSYNPITVQNSGVPDTFSVNVQPVVLASGTTGAPYVSGVVNRTWYVEKSLAGSSNISLTTQWNAADELPGVDRTNVSLRHYTSGSWDNGTYMPSTGSGPYMLTRSNITSLSPFAVMSNTAVLPLNLVSFSAKSVNNNVQLTWATDLEINMDKFIVEKSNGNTEFATVAVVPAKGFSTLRNYYETSDNSLTQGTYFYRLKMLNIDGSFKYSKTIVVKISNDDVFSIYPNPAVDFIEIRRTHTAGLSVIRITDAKGKVVKQLNIFPGNSILKLSMENLAKGIYSVTLESASGKQIKQIVKQ